MLDSLGSTLSRSTVSSFFTRYNKQPHEEELTLAEAIQCLETELGRPDSEKKRIDSDDSLLDSSVSVTPTLMLSEESFKPLSLDDLDFSGSFGNLVDLDRSPTLMPPQPLALVTKNERLTLGGVSGPGKGLDPLEVGCGYPPVATLSVGQPPSYPEPVARQVSYSSSDAEDSSGSASNGSSPTSSDLFERVINIKNCPLCLRPRLNSKAEVDIVTHLAVCASQDWAKVDRIVVGNFVTASQAQRKWYTRIISKVSGGDYRLGAVSFASWFGLLY
jgi:phosphatidylserine decarboxylase